MATPKIFTLLFSFICISVFCDAQTPVKPDKNFHLYILMGQSNMAGRGQIDDDLKKLSHASVFMLDKNGEWQPASHPVHFDKPSVVGVGPGLSFGIEMAKADTNIRIGLIPCAVGGTSIEKWKPSAYDQTTQTHPYDDAVSRIKDAMQYGIIKGVLWHQGEANSSARNSENYLLKLQDLIKRVRELTNNEQLPVVIGELGQFKEQYQTFNKILKEATLVIPYTALATSEQLTDKGDTTHFDGVSAHEYGKRFAQKMMELQKIKSQKTANDK